MKKYTAKIWSKKEIEDLKDLIKRGKSFLEISRELNRTKSSVKNYYRSHKEELEVIYNPTKVIKTLTTKQKEILNLYQMGCSSDTLSKTYNMSKNQIYHLARNSGTKQLSLKEQTELGYLNGKYIGLDRKNFEDLVYNKRKSVSKIAEEFGFSIEFIRHRMRVLKIKPAGTLDWEDRRAEFIFKIYGRKITNKERNTSLYKLITQDKLVELLEIFDYNVSYLCKEMNIDKNIIRNSIKYYKINIPEKKTIKDYPTEFFLKLLNQGYTIMDISEVIGFCKDYVREYLNNILPNHETIIQNKYKSHGEYMTARALENLKISFKHDDLYKVNNNEIPQESIYIDFTVQYNNINYWIEYNGDYHYKPNNHFFSDIEKFISRVKRDLYVKKRAKSEGIVFLEIPYTYYSTKRIQNLLQRVIINGEDINGIIDYAPFYEEIKKLGISIDN